MMGAPDPVALLSHVIYLPVAQAASFRAHIPAGCGGTCRGRHGKPPLYVRATYEREPSDAMTQRACCRTTAWSASGFGLGLGFGLGFG